MQIQKPEQMRSARKSHVESQEITLKTALKILQDSLSASEMGKYASSQATRGLDGGVETPSSLLRV